MYVPEIFEERHVGTLHQLIATHPLGALVTMTAGGLDANHIPFLIDTEPAPFGTLHGHVARANPLWRHAADAEALVTTVFFWNSRTHSCIATVSDLTHQPIEL